MFFMHRARLWKPCVVMCSIAAVMILSAMPSTATEGGLTVVTSARFDRATIYDVMKLDISRISDSMSVDGVIQLDVLGSRHSFSVVPAGLQIAPNQEPDLAAKCLDESRFFKGTGDAGPDCMRATVTPNWMHFALVLNGNDYFIDPADDSGDSGYYVLYSLDGARTGAVDLSNDVLDLPAAVASSAESMSASQPASPGAADNSSAVVAEAVTEQVDFMYAAGAVSAATDSNPKNKTCESGGADPEYRLARIIMACDVEYRNQYPSDWSARIVSTLNDMCGRYESQVSISFKLSINPWSIPSGQCTSTNPATLLDQFRTYMLTDSSVSGVVRDVSHLCTGKNLNGDILGVSWEPGVGSAKWSTADYAYSLSEQWHDSSQNMITMGHELGHCFNGDHAYWTWIGSAQSWMTPYTSWPVTAQFSTNNANRIRSWAQQALDLQRSTNPGPSSVSSDNLQSTNLAQEGQFIYFVSIQNTITFNIKNTGSTGITLDWLFVGARDASGANRDFGYQYSVWIGAGQTYKYTGTYTPSSGGMWTLWPAYKVGSHYGPFMWITITPTMYYDKGHWVGVDTTTSSHNVDLFYRFYVLTTVSTPTVGSTVTVSVSMYNGQTGTGTTTFNYLFVGCRNAQQNKDFGYSSQQVMTQKAGSSSTGGGWLVQASRTLDSSGTWSFWPAYNVGGSYGPSQWHAVTLTI